MRGAISVAFLERIETIFAEHQRKLLTDYIAAKERAGINDEKLAAATTRSSPRRSGLPTGSTSSAAPRPAR